MGVNRWCSTIASVIEPRPDRLEILQAARGRFQEADLTPASLDRLGQSILRAQHDHDSGFDEMWETATASVEYLDQSVQVSWDELEVATVQGVTRELADAICVLQGLLQDGQWTIDDREPQLSLDGYLLAAYTALTIDHVTGLIPDAAHRRSAEDAAWSLIGSVVRGCSDGCKPGTGAKLFAVRTAADALEVCSNSLGQLILKKVTDKTKPLPQLALRNAAHAAPKPIVLSDLDLIASNLTRRPSLPVHRLPRTTAEDRDRDRDGRGLAAVGSRMKRWEIGKLIRVLGILPFVAFALSAFPPTVILDVNLVASDALNSGLQLLAVSATLAIALAISTHHLGDESREQALRWWNIGTWVQLACALLTLVVGLDLIKSDPAASGTAFIVIVLAALQFALFAGISQWHLDLRLEGAATKRVKAMRSLRLETVKAKFSEGPGVRKTILQAAGFVLLPAILAAVVVALITDELNFVSVVVLTVLIAAPTLVAVLADVATYAQVLAVVSTGYARSYWVLFALATFFTMLNGAEVASSAISGVLAIISGTFWAAASLLPGATLLLAHRVPKLPQFAPRIATYWGAVVFRFDQ